MTKNYLGLCLAGIVITGILLTPAAYAEDMGGLILDLTPEVTAQTTDAALEFQPVYIKVVKIIDKTEVTFWESDITEQEDISIPAPAGKYKLYVTTHLTAGWDKRISSKRILNRIEHTTPVLPHCGYIPADTTKHICPSSSPECA